MTKEELKYLSGQTLEKLKEQLFLFKKELFNLRFQKKVSGELKNTSIFSKIRKNIARINTELSKRKKGA